LVPRYDQLVKLQEGDDAVPEAAVIWAMRAAAKKLTFEPILSDPRVLIEIGGPATTTAMLADLPVAKGSDGEGSEAVTIDFELLGIADTGESKDDDGEVDLSWLTQVTADKALAQAKTDFFQLVIHHIRLAVDTTTPKRLKQAEKAIPTLVDKLTSGHRQLICRQAAAAAAALTPTHAQEAAADAASAAALSGSHNVVGTKVFFSPDGGTTLQVASVSAIADPLSADSPLTLKTKKKKPAATADQVAVYAEKNQRLLYARPKDGALVEVDVLSVLQTIWPPSYFIKLEDGLEKDTEASRVFPLQYKKALEERTSFAALREGAKLDVCPGGAGAAAEAAAAGAAAATATSGGGGGGGGKAEGSNETKASEVSETTVRDPDEPPKKRRDEQGKKKKKKKK